MLKTKNEDTKKQKVMGTFQIELLLWNSFLKQSIDNDISASERIRDFIKKELETPPRKIENLFIIFKDLVEKIEEHLQQGNEDDKNFDFTITGPEIKQTEQTNKTNE